MWSDEEYMQVALRLGARNLGQTAENPSVGCVIVKDGRMLAHGWTQAGGRPHAEQHALCQLPDDCSADGATIYVTLEPCAHTGKTPPCAQALVRANVSRVVIGVGDPDMRVSGKGVAQLQAANIAVTCGVHAAQAQALHAGFFRRLTQGIPEITVKIATSINGYITTGIDEQPWITRMQARLSGHALRAHHDAIITGIGTVLADNPQLTCRLPGREWRSPQRIVLDSQLRLPLGSALVKTSRDAPVWVITTQAAYRNVARRNALEQAGVRCVALGDTISWLSVMRWLAAEGINRVMVEGGARITSTMLASGLASRLAWFRSPNVITHPKALPATIGDVELSAYIDEAAPVVSTLCGRDTLSIYELTQQ